MSVETGDFRIVGAIHLCDFHPSFGLAIAVTEAAQGYWLQITSPGTQKVRSFALISENEWTDVQRVADRPVRIGDDYVHAFLDKNGALYLDTASELRVLFNVVLNDRETSSTTKLAICEELGLLERARTYRRDSIEAATKAFGPHAARSFESSAARATLWEILESAAVNDAALQRIQTARPYLIATIAQDRSISIDISLLDPADLRLSVEEVSNRLRNLFGMAHSEYKLSRVDLRGLPSSTDPTIVTILEAVQRSPRQEERLAILIRSLILHPVPAISALDHYSDPAQMARTSMERLRSLFRALPDNATEEDREIRVASTIPAIIADAYPRRRGVILFYLAQHLSDFFHITTQIKAALTSRHSLEIEELRPRIEEALNKKNSFV